MAAGKRAIAKRRTRIETASALEHVAKQLERLGVWSEFRSLVEAGCEADMLLVAFSAVVPYSKRDSWAWLFAFSRRRVQTAIRRLRECGDVVKRLNHSQAAHEFAKSRPELDLGVLQETLHDYAEFLTHQARRQSGFNPRGRPNFNSARAQITAYVKVAANGPHDRELAHIFSQLTNGRVTADAQKVWRRENAELIRKTGRFLPMAEPSAPRKS